MAFESELEKGSFIPYSINLCSLCIFFLVHILILVRVVEGFRKKLIYYLYIIAVSLARSDAFLAIVPNVHMIAVICQFRGKHIMESVVMCLKCCFVLITMWNDLLKSMYYLFISMTQIKVCVCEIVKIMTIAKTILISYFLLMILFFAFIRFLK